MDLKKEPMNSTDLNTQGESHADVKGIAGTPETPVTEPETGYIEEGAIGAAPATVEGQSEQSEATDDEPAAENDAD